MYDWIQFSIGRLQSIIQVAKIKVEVSNLVKFKARDTILELLHFHLINELPRHHIPLLLLLLLMLQVTANYVEDVVLESEAIAKTAFISHRSHKHVFALGNLV